VGRRDAGLEYGRLEVAGVRRGYWRARGPDGPSGILLMVLHGSGTSGKAVATIFTGLATRGPAAGVTTVFPDGWHGVWHIARPPSGEPALDDAAFLVALVEAGGPGGDGGPGLGHGQRDRRRPGFRAPGTRARGSAGDPADLVRARLPAGGAVPVRGRRARLAGRAAVPAGRGHRPHPPPSGRDRILLEMI